MLDTNVELLQRRRKMENISKTFGVHYSYMPSDYCYSNESNNNCSSNNNSNSIIIPRSNKRFLDSSSNYYLIIYTGNIMEFRTAKTKHDASGFGLWWELGGPSGLVWTTGDVNVRPATVWGSTIIPSHPTGVSFGKIGQKEYRDPKWADVPFVFSASGGVGPQPQ